MGIPQPQATYQDVLGALADPTRREVLLALRTGPASVRELADRLPVSRPAVSQHLRVLRDSGLVSYEMAGTRNVYRLDPAGLRPLQAWLDEFWGAALGDFVAYAERPRARRDTRMTPEETTARPLLHTVRLAQPPAAAFALFTADFARWWPRATHSVGGERSTNVHFGTAAGEQIIETVAGEAPATWGTITVWDPPYRVAFSWHPGSPEPQATHVEVTFISAGDHTEVTLRHTGWANRPDGPAARADYADGWPVVLDSYRAAAGAR